MISERQLEQALAALPVCKPRVVASGNLASPRALLNALERAVECYRLFMLAAQAPLPAREGVIFETPFVGPGMRDAAQRLDYLPMRLSLVPTVRRDAPPRYRAASHLYSEQKEGFAGNRGEHPARRRAAHPAMVSINTALQVDLHDQAGASHS